MKHRLMLFFLLYLMMLACACNEQNRPAVSIPNPVVCVESSEAFAALDLFLDAPKDAINVAYSIIADSVAQVLFELKDSRVYIFRAAHTEDDISGVYATFDEEELAIDVDAEDWTASIRVRSIDGGASGALASWYDAETNTQYSLYTGRAIEKEILADLSLMLAETVLSAAAK